MNANEIVAEIQAKAKSAGQYLRTADAGVRYLAYLGPDGTLRVSEIVIGGATKRTIWHRDRPVTDEGQPLAPFGPLTKSERRWSRLSRAMGTPQDAIQALQGSLTARLQKARRELAEAEKAWRAAGGRIGDFEEDDAE